MAVTNIDFGRLVEPVSPDDVCGPDLDEAGDPLFLQTVARLEGLLPASFLTHDLEGRLQPFDRTTIAVPAELKLLLDLLQTSRDLRLLTLCARLSALNRDLGGLAACLGGIAGLLVARWDEVHPRAEAGEFFLRTATLQALDDMPTVVLPLQYTTLAENRRDGAVTFRSVMVATDQASAREGEQVKDRAAVDRILREADLDALRNVHDHLSAIRDAVATIRTLSVEKLGYDQAVSLDRLQSLVDKILATVRPVLLARDPAAETALIASPVVGPAESGLGQVATSPAGPVTSLGDVTAALGTAVSYLRSAEPSGPAELLVRQAAELVGKSFLDVLRILVPGHAEDTTIPIGADKAFRLSFQQLAAVGGTGDDAAGEAAVPSQSATFTARTRADAMGLLREVTAYYRKAEPSSPIPLLLERALGMMDRDFLAILRDVLPGLVETQTS